MRFCVADPQIRADGQFQQGRHRRADRSEEQGHRASRSSAKWPKVCDRRHGTSVGDRTVATWRSIPRSHVLGNERVPALGEPEPFHVKRPRSPEGAVSPAARPAAPLRLFHVKRGGVPRSLTAAVQGYVRPDKGRLAHGSIRRTGVEPVSDVRINRRECLPSGTLSGSDDRLREPEGGRRQDHDGHQSRKLSGARRRASPRHRSRSLRPTRRAVSASIVAPSSDRSMTPSWMGPGSPT